MGQTGTAIPSPPLLQVDNLHASYQQVIEALRGVSLEVPQGSVVALLGANGAGKTTTLKAISGLLAAERGEVTAGTLQFAGSPITQTDPADLVRRGLVQVLEGRHCFEHLSVEENLKVGAAILRPSRAALATALARIYHYFPRLKLLRGRLAGYTSGGEQQMVAIGRALIGNPRLVLLDEPSMGLAPLVVEEIFEIIVRLHAEEGTSFLLAEQNATLALKHAHHGYILENGRVAISGPAEALREREDVRSFYLGVGAAGRESFRDGGANHRRRRDSGVLA